MNIIPGPMMPGPDLGIADAWNEYQARVAAEERELIRLSIIRGYDMAYEDACTQAIETSGTVQLRIMNERRCRLRRITP